MKKEVITLFFVIAYFIAFSQTGGFYTEIRDFERKTWRVGGVIETEDGFIFSLRDQSSSIMTSKLIKVSSSGELLKEKSITSVDTAVNLISLFNCFNDDGIVGLGVCIPPNDTALLLTICFDENLEVTLRSLTTLPKPDHWGYGLDDCKFLQVENGFFALLGYLGKPTEQEYKLCKISAIGEITKVEKMADSLVAYGASLFRVHDYPDGLGLFIGKPHNFGSQASTRALIYDSNLRLRRVCDIFNWHEDDGAGNVYTGRLSTFNSMILPSPMDGYYISARFDEYLLQGSITKHDRSSLLAKTDSNFTIQPHHCITVQFNDTVEVPSFYKSADINERGVVYQCSMQNINFDSWPYSNRGTHLVIMKTSEDLEIVWQKKFLKDGNVYSAFQTLATSDDGCLVVGNVYDHNPELCQDIFVLKTNTDGFVGTEIFSYETRILIYPNPTHGLITIHGANLNYAEVYNAFGQYTTSVQSNNGLLEVDLSNYPSGIYLITIKNQRGRKCIKKVVKQ